MSGRGGFYSCYNSGASLFVKDISSFNLQYSLEVQYSFELDGETPGSGIALLSDARVSPGLMEYFIFGPSYYGMSPVAVSVSGAIRTGTGGCDDSSLTGKPGNTGPFEITTEDNQGYLKVLKQDLYYFFWKRNQTNDWTLIGSLTTKSKINYIGVVASSFSTPFKVNYTDINFQVPVCGGKLATDKNVCPYQNQICSFKGVCSITLQESTQTIDLSISSIGQERLLWNCQNLGQANLILKDIEYPNFSFESSYSLTHMYVGYGFHAGIILYYEENGKSYFVMFGPSILSGLSYDGSISLQASLDIDCQLTAQKFSKLNGNYGPFEIAYQEHNTGNIKVVRSSQEGYSFYAKGSAGATWTLVGFVKTNIVFPKIGFFLRTFPGGGWTDISFANIVATTTAQCTNCSQENMECSVNNECSLDYDEPLPNYKQDWTWHNPSVTGYPRLQLTINETEIKIKSTIDWHLEDCQNLGGVFYREIPYAVGWSAEARMTNVVFDAYYSSGLILYTPNPKRYYLKVGFHTNSISLSGDLGNGCFENKVEPIDIFEPPLNYYFKISRTLSNAYQFYFRPNTTSTWNIIGTVDSSINFNRLGYFTMGYTTYSSATFTDFKLNLPTCDGKNHTDTTICSGKGKCVGYNSCTCNAGSYGQFCHLNRCFGIYSNQPNVCSGNGVCESNDKCKCNNGFYGDKCEKSVCWSSMVASDGRIVKTVASGLCDRINTVLLGR
ncbi:hypothetical protein ABK040_016009 [Willaertia magna]